jgi:GrpB-like predicted nucleotidyltransferase (UPF0157 family)
MLNIREVRIWKKLKILTMKPHRPYKLKKYDPDWKSIFLNAKDNLLGIFGDEVVEIEHIGSTSIEGMVAKPQVGRAGSCKRFGSGKELL